MTGSVFYKLGDAMYVNITNRCSCDCVFCIRKNGDAVGDASSLWLAHEPTLDEIRADFAKQDLHDIREIVFCGYGEPLERADDAVAICEHIKSACDLPVRLNTNGLVALFNPDFDIERLRVFDAISVSLNSDNAHDYQRATRFAKADADTAFAAMLDFAAQCKNFAEVMFSVVAFPKCEEYWNEEKCRQISAKMQIPLRIREYSG